MPAHQPAQQKASLEQQIIEGRYIERDKLMKLLEHTFGKGNFVVRLQLNRWILAVPMKLTEEQIDTCCSLE
ncbi:uncharacterized protein LY89DRAFT_778053 [Mollisia scopiformis]|uniref:Uncharacterized protein n=1 Tax=Mollisia scopiformis TaxID=149040 RepID=A0A194XNC7_MOLSC|nr:uncharacterized protein LY89DRAFT_778053 [Mollisia scopiformis]KUJ21646.1 hypothetical protein LY89DRAFT_778053 [Mollisia scopiformis]